MVSRESKSQRVDASEIFNFSYAVLVIMVLLTIGATAAYHQNSPSFAGDEVSRWTPAVFLIGICISLMIFGLTHREAAARLVLQRRTRDLIEAEKQNKALLEAEQRSRITAEQANLAKDEFLAVVSHELKTPLNAIAGWARILKTRDVSEDTRNTALSKIDKNLRIQTAIIDELLGFSDVMSSGLRLRGKRVVMRDVFEDAVAAVSVAAFQKGVTFATDDRLDGECVLGDRGRLKIALLNVLTNAVKFTPAGGSVTVEAFDCEGCFRCVITDTGLGIPPDFLPHIFEPYKQSEHVSTRHYGGLGLGLTIAEHIVKLHHGSIEAESQGIGAGSKFTINIPSGGSVNTSTVH